MIPFDTIYNEYEKTRNVCQFCESYRKDSTATRFLLIRSLDSSHLKDIINDYTDESPNGRIRDLTKKVYESKVTIEQLLAYIEAQRPSLIEERSRELEGLPELLSTIPIERCGVRNDKIDDIVKKFVRNKDMKSKEELDAALETLLSRVQQYSLWSYYNQTANDIIELFFLSHPTVIPTLRKIHDIDFFLRVDGQIIPFDLKFTHISDAYFDLASQGIYPKENCSLKVPRKELSASSQNPYDDFFVATGDSESESKQIKAYYSAFKKAHPELKLPNMSGLSKEELIDTLNNTRLADAVSFVRNAKAQHARYVPTTPKQLRALEWWNYKYQGERLFCNNNRLFVFLAYRNKFVDGRELKGQVENIGRKITSLLDQLSAADIHSVHYHYDKDPELVGNYHAHSLSTIYYE